MKKHLFILLCFMSSLAWGQTRPGSGPDAEDLTIEQYGELVASSVDDNTKKCSSTQKFKNVIEIYNYVSVKNVAAKGKPDCSELQPKVSVEVRCLFKGMPQGYLHKFTAHDKETFIKYLDKEFKLSDKEAAPVWEFYNHLDWSIDNE